MIALASGALLLLYPLVIYFGVRWFGVAIRKRYDVKMDADSAATREHFTSIASLARFIEGSHEHR